MNIKIFALWFKAADAKHQTEIDEAFRRNCALKIAFLKVEASGKRHNFNEVFDLAAQEPRDTICVTANADCYWDETLNNVLQKDLWGKFLCITRHIHGVLNLQPQGCQDGWVWLSQCTPRLPEPLEFGRYGVDGKLNYYLLHDTYAFENPCREIKLHHLHEQGNFSSPSRFPAYEGPLGFVAPANRRGQTKTWIENTPGERNDHLPTVRTRQGVDAKGKLFIESW